MPIFTDQTGRSIVLDHEPRRIVSLVPSQTELLADLGLEKQVKGITKFCVHPDEWFKIKTKVGGTKQINLEAIQQLRPDLIIANKEENVREQIEELASYFPVWVSDVNNLPDAYHMITAIGGMTGKIRETIEMNELIKESFDQLQLLDQKRRAAYLIWREPYMTVGGDTFINSMMNVAGFENIYGDEKRYPIICIEDLLHCDYLLLASEPFPFKHKHVEALQVELPNTKILLVDGEMFSWYGSRLLKAAEYFKSLF